MTRIPRLLDRDLREVCPIRPLTYSLTEQLTPLSTAKLSVPAAAVELSGRDFVVLSSPRGCEGIYRVKSLSTDVSITEVVLQHGLCTLADHMHPGEEKKTGSLQKLLTDLLANQSRWVLGDCEFPEDKELTWKVNNSNDLESLTNILAEVPGYRVVTDQSALPWVMHIRALPSDVGCECRLERNITDVQIEYDTSDMCTRAYVDGLDAPMDADTIGKWGEIARHVSVDKDLKKDLVRETVERYLDKNKNPRATITLTAVELSRLTGEPFDAFEVGQLCRCILPDMTAVLRIVTIQRPDPIGSPEHAVLTLASVQEDLGVTIAGLVVDTRHVNQLYRTMEQNLRVEAETIEMLAEEIALKASQADVTAMGLRLSQAEIDIDGANAAIELRAQQATVDALDGRLTTEEAALEVLSSNMTLYVKKDDDISGMIELSGDGVTISGGTITLTGYITADELEAQTLVILGDYFSAMGDVDLGNVAADSVNASSISGDTISFDTLNGGGITASALTVGGSTCSPHTLSIGGKSCAFFAPSDATFELSDMPGYADALDAARTEGASAGYDDGYNDGFTDGFPTEISRVAAYDSAANTYKLSIVMTFQNGPTMTHDMEDIDAAAAYDAGYAAGFQAAKDATRVVGAITSIKNYAPNRMLANGWAKATVDGEQVDYTTFNKTQEFPGLGQG